MEREPTVHHYRVSDRAEVLDFIREVFPADEAARETAQWVWKYEIQPFAPAGGAAVNFIRVGEKIVGLSAGYRTPMWMGGIECFGEGRGNWIIHPEYRGQNLWRRTKSLQAVDSPIIYGWSKMAAHSYQKFKWVGDPVRPLIRILDAGPILAHFAGSNALASLASAATSAARFLSRPLHHASRGRRRAVVRLDSFDERADALWKRARPASGAMIVRDQSYLNWRYRDRPDASYLLYGLEEAAELEGFLAARFSTYRGMRWGYLVDFLAPETSREVLTALIGEALEELRRLGAAAVACFATDRTSRSALLHSGFLPLPQTHPVHFIRFMKSQRTDLARFVPFTNWYVTMGDGDFDMLS